MSHAPLVAAVALTAIFATAARADRSVSDGDFLDESAWNIQAGPTGPNAPTGGYVATGGNPGKYIGFQWSLAAGPNLGVMGPFSNNLLWDPSVDGAIVRIIGSVDVISSAPEDFDLIAFAFIQNGHIFGVPITLTAADTWQSFSIDVDPLALPIVFGPPFDMDFSDTAPPINFGIFVFSQPTGTGDEPLVTLGFDNIHFTAIAPEPATLGMLALTAAALMRARRR